LAERGIRHDPRNPEAVVLGYDTELTYDKLARASLLLHDPGMPYFATHTDRVCPTEKGSIPDIGAIMSLIETATGRRPDAALGKPDPRMVRHLFERTGVPPRQSVFFGDRVYTDYDMARSCDALFVDAQKNRYLANGHNYQSARLPVYLPGNGGLLTAVAMMAAGWDGCPDRPSPGFPDNGRWNVRWEGLRPMP